MNCSGACEELGEKYPRGNRLEIFSIQARLEERDGAALGH